MKNILTAALLTLSMYCSSVAQQQSIVIYTPEEQEIVNLSLDFADRGIGSSVAILRDDISGSKSPEKVFVLGPKAKISVDHIRVAVEGDRAGFVGQVHWQFPGAETAEDGGELLLKFERVGANWQMVGMKLGAARKR